MIFEPKKDFLKINLDVSLDGVTFNKVDSIIYVLC